MKKIHKLQIAVWILALFVSIPMLSGCGRSDTKEAETDTVTLWVVTEQSLNDGMNLQAEMIVERMEKAHKNLTIKLEILPQDEEVRELYLKQLQTQIMAGGGPDVYLLPMTQVLTVGRITVDTYLPSTRVEIDPLFPDIAQAMHSGIFADIQEYYAADEDLGTDTLKKEIMDAGCIGDSRYVLPLRYNMPVVFTLPEKWEEYGLSENAFKSDISELTRTLMAQENGAFAAAGIQLPSDLTAFSQVFDYEKGELLVTAEEIADYMRLYQAWNAVATGSTQTLIDDALEKALQFLPDGLGEYLLANFNVYQYDFDTFNSIYDYICDDVYWGNTGLPVYANDLADSLHTVAISRVQQQDTLMYPLKAAGGGTVAEVTYIGAVGGGCANPELAYEFLRLFLTEEFQWEIYRPRIDKTLPLSDPMRKSEVQNKGQVEYSWPVRTVGSVEYIWDNIQYQEEDIFSNYYSPSIARTRKIQNSRLIEGDDALPALAWAIDEVRFPIFQGEDETLEYALSLLNDENGNPTDADIDALAEQVWLNLWWHLAEG